MPNSLERVETPRMVATRLEPDDLRDVARLLGDPRVARTLSPTGLPLGEREVLVSLDEKLRHWEDYQWLRGSEYPWGLGTGRARDRGRISALCLGPRR